LAPVLLRAQVRALIVAIPLFAAGCASSPTTDTIAIDPASGTAQPPAAQAAEYQLTDEEKALDCKKLTGRMQVRILQVRDYGARQKTSSTSRALQSATTTVLGGSKEGSDPDGEHKRSLAQLEAYNKQLAAKGCKTFNLAEELQPKPVTATPQPVAPQGGNGKSDTKAATGSAKTAKAAKPKTEEKAAAGSAGSAGSSAESKAAAPGEEAPPEGGP
jgi:hypothetical protein